MSLYRLFVFIITKLIFYQIIFHQLNQSSNPASLDSSMLPIESLWSRQSVPGPSGNTVNVSPGNTVNVSPGNPVNVQPGNAGFGETDLPSFADSAIGTGSVS